jgi:hypothetical protein
MFDDQREASDVKNDVAWRQRNVWAAWFSLRALALTFDFCLSTSIPVLTTSTYVVVWPQGACEDLDL